MPASPPPEDLPFPPEGNEYRGSLIDAFTLWTNVFVVIFVVLRIITRIWLVKARLWFDDYFIVVAMVFTIAGGALDAVEVHFGFGRPEKYNSDHALQYFSAYTFGEWVQTFLTLMCTKVSICFFLLRIPINKKYIRPLQVSIVLLIVSHVAIIFVWVFQCHPVAAAWNSNIDGQCFTRKMMLNVILAQAIISVISDFALAVYPILILWNVKTKLKNKVGLCILMGLGVITGVCCVVRTALNGGALPTDATFGGVTNWFWRLFEVQLGIIIACIPPLIPFYKWLRHRVDPHRKFSASHFIKPPTAHDIKLPRGRDPREEQRFDPRARKSERALLGRDVFGGDFHSKDLESQPDVEHIDIAAPAPAAIARGNKRGFSDIGLPILGPRVESSLSNATSQGQSSEGYKSSEQTVVGDESSTVQYLKPPSPKLAAAMAYNKPSPGPTVKTTDDPQQSLEVDLRPNFDANRGMWARMLDTISENRLSWRIKDMMNTGFTPKSSSRNSTTNLPLGTKSRD